MRFRAEQHLRRPSEIRAVRELGRRVEGRAFTVWFRRRPAASADAAPAPTSPALARVCVIASTAAVGNAVRRNRAKRRLRELFRLHQADVPRDCDLLLIARRAATEWTMPELEASFRDVCRRLAPERRPE